MDKIKVDYKRNIYYSKGKGKTVSIIQMNRKSKKKKVVKKISNRNPNLLYYVNGDGTIGASPRVKH